MERRKFLKGLSAALASIPVVGYLVPNTVAAPVTESIETVETMQTIFNSERLSKLIKFYTKNPRAIKMGTPNHNRVPIVDYKSDSDILSEKNVKGTYMLSGIGTYILADALSDSEGALMYGNPDEVEFITTKLPQLKSGQRISDKFLTKIHRMLQDNNKDAQKYYAAWEDTLAQSIAKGLQNRRTSLEMMFMLGGKAFNHGMKINFDLGVPEGIHVTNKFEKRPLAVIKKHLKTVKNQHNVKYDRMTISTNLFRELLYGTPRFQGMDLGTARKATSKALKLEIEIDDSVFFERGNNGEKNAIPYLPKNKILFSVKANDNNEKVFHFGSLLPMEAVMSELLNLTVVRNADSGPIGYFTVANEINPASVTGWGVMRGLPVLKDKTAFSSITIER